MGAQIVSFFLPRGKAKSSIDDWSQQELAEFYRVESALVRAGLSIETDRGMSDEGEPWFVFVRAEDGEVVIHFARIDGEYLIAGPAYERIARGFDFGALVRNMIARHPLIQPQRRDGNVYLHPSAILIAIVGTAFFKTGEAKAMDDSGAPSAPTRSGVSTAAQGRKVSSASTSTPPSASATINQSYSVTVDANQALAIIAGAMMALETNHFSSSSSAAFSQAVSVIHTASAVQIAPSIDRQPSEIDRVSSASEQPVQSMDAQQIANLLGVIAVLNDLATPALAAAQTATTALDLSATHAPTAAQPLATIPESPAAWLIDIRLSSTGEPLAEAAQLVRQVVFGGSFEHVAVIELATLPSLLVNILARGLQVHGADVVSTTIEAPTMEVAPVVLSPSQPVPPTDIDPLKATPPPANGPSATDEPSLIVIDTPAPPPPAKAPPESVFSSKAAVDIFVSYFLSHSVRPEVVVAAKTIVIFDQDVLHRMDPSTIESVTFQFDDGSAISLIGASKSMHHEIGLG